MQERPTPAALRAVTDALATPIAGDVLRTALATTGDRLRDWSVRSVHRRGDTGIAVVLRVDLVDVHGEARDRLYVVHASARAVPPGATRTRVEGVPVHVWAFPHDPYLPGLPTAVSTAAARTLLARHGSTSTAPAIRTRSYRPTRRAVVELRPAAAAEPALYLKLLGGRTARRVHDRTTQLVGTHDALTAGGLPVPPVLEHDVEAGCVVLGAVRGRTLRDLLRSGAATPPAAELLDVVGRMQRVGPLHAGGDPDGFADVTRHVALLGDRLPRRRRDLRDLAAAAAAVAGPVGTVHGDLHDGQVVVDDGRVTGLLDVDGAGTGHVAHDLGRLLAGIEASAMAAQQDDEGTAEKAELCLAAVLRGTEALCPPADVARATAAAWVGLATGPLRVASPTWRQETEQRLDRALDWARRAD